MTTEQRSSSNTLSITGDFDLGTPETELHFADGRIIHLPTALLLQAAPPERPYGATPDSESILIPLIEEQLQVSKRVIETGKLQLHKAVDAYDVMLDEPLAISTWQIERIAKNEVVDQAPLTWQEGETTVYPIVEERLVLTKELVLIEEVRVTRTISERRDTSTITLRRETLSVERETPTKL